MQDLPRSPNELMPEVTALIPYFIENLGNSKVSYALIISFLLLAFCRSARLLFT